MKSVLITLLAYNAIGLAIYYAGRYRRTAGIIALLYLVGVYLPIVVLIEAVIIACRGHRKQGETKDVFHLTQEVKE